MHDLIIVGGGAAGLAAAAYALDKQLDVMVVYENLGGKINQKFTMHADTDFLVGHILVHLDAPETTSEEVTRLGAETVQEFERQVTTQRGRALFDRVRRVTKEGDVFKVETERSGTLQAAAVIIASGAVPKQIDAPGREFINHGIGYTPVTFARALAGKTAVVIGCTQRALRGAAELAPTAAQVYLVAPKFPHDDPIFAVLRKRPNVEVLEGYTVTEVTGTTTVDTVVVEQDGKVRRLPVDAAFADVGLTPNSAMVKDVVETDADGFIIVDKRNATSLPGLFAAGDVTTVYGEHTLIAIGEGARAALAAHDYLLARG
ncbi:NAD(P)/FAD-dependent oxidoreductase [Roseiflexus castenholzii]|uniref:NAD(P)/FAD-dependent oxidoreductase n=1 Tax=Roseiflexus castenholzii TaxID=120962 RepID=UPI003C7C052D